MKIVVIAQQSETVANMCEWRGLVTLTPDPGSSKDIPFGIGRIAKAITSLYKDSEDSDR